MPVTGRQAPGEPSDGASGEAARAPAASGVAAIGETATGGTATGGTATGGTATGEAATGETAGGPAPEPPAARHRTGAQGPTRFARLLAGLGLAPAGSTILLVTLGLLGVQAGTAWQIVRQGRATAIGNARASVGAAAEGAAAAVSRTFLSVDSALAGLPGLLSAVLPAGVAGGPVPEGTLLKGSRLEGSRLEGSRLEGSMAEASRADGPPVEGSAAARSLALSRVLMGLADSTAGIRDLILLPLEGGTPLAAALPASRRLPPPVPLADLLQAAGDAAGAGARATIAGPAPNPHTGEWALFLTRRVALAGSGPAPAAVLAVAELPVPVIAASLAALGPWGQADGLQVMLVRSEDGVLLASAPHDEARIGRPLPRAAFPGAESGPFSEVRRTLYPSMQVLAVQDVAPALAGWAGSERRILLAAAGLAGLTVGIAGLLLAMLRQRDRAEAERARSMQVLEASIEAMSDGFVMWDGEDRLIVCNRRYREFYRESAPAIRPGATMTDIMRYGAEHGQYPQSGADKAGFVEEAMAHYRHAWNTAPVERLLPDGRWILVTERRVPGGGSVGIRTDITQQKRAAAELAEARDAAAAAGAAKSRFLARMSHELRTPLNGVLGMAQALATDPGLTPEQRGRAAMLEAAGRHLLGVANDVLDLAHVEAGRMPLRPAPVALAALLRTCAELIRPAAEAAGIEVANEDDPALPPAAMLDAMRVRQLLLNLLSNAVKFTSRGGRVRLRGVPLGAAGPAPLLRLEVLDNGPGVPADRRVDVFQDFVRLERAGVAPPTEGFGLGLAIATGIVQAMGGRLGVDDNPEAAAAGGTGARFWVELPLVPAVMPEAAPDSRPYGVGLGRRALRVLVVDDVQTNRLVARALLERSGHRAELVEGGAEALEAVVRAVRAGEAFDAVLMDLAMPGMDGREATRRLRALPAADGGGVPVVALTAGVFDADEASCRDLGMSGYLAKPMTLEALQEELARVTAGLPSAVPAGTG